MQYLATPKRTLLPKDICHPLITLQLPDEFGLQAGPCRPKG